MDKVVCLLSYRRTLGYYVRSCDAIELLTRDEMQQLPVCDVCAGTNKFSSPLSVGSKTKKKYRLIEWNRLLKR